MTIQEILKKRKIGQKFSSETCEMFEQDLESLMYWLLSDGGCSRDELRLRLFETILIATDWKLDELD